MSSAHLGLFRNRVYSLWKDIGERAMWTFIQTFLAVEGFDTFATDALTGRLNLHWLSTAYVAAAAAFIAVVKGYFASKANPPSAALPNPVGPAKTDPLTNPRTGL